jgi:glyoxylase I family protein
MVEDFLHVAITCRDLERSIRFYESLGLKVTRRFGEIQEEGIARALQLPSCRLKVVHLAPPDAASGMFIDLVQWLDPLPAGGPYPTLTHVGINRVAFRVSDIDATTAALREKRITFLSDEPQSLGSGIRGIVTTDPDGVYVQFVEGL